MAISARGEQKMQKVKDEITSSTEVEVATFAIDYSKKTDYGEMVNPDSKILRNLSIVINNVGLYPKGRSLESKPEDMEAAMKVNLYSIVLLSKVARNSFKAQHEEDPDSGPFGLIQVSSLSGIRSVLKGNLYCACKRFDYIFADVFR